MDGSLELAGNAIANQRARNPHIFARRVTRNMIP
jgi:hypothetical protein